MAIKQGVQPRSAVWAGPGCGAQQMSHPPSRPSARASPGLLHPQKHDCSILGLQRTKKPDRKAASFPRPDMPHIASRLQQTGSCYRRGSQQRQRTGPCAPAAARGQMAAGTRGTGNAKKGEVEELKPAQGLNFCLPSKRRTQRGEMHPRLWWEHFTQRLHSLPGYNGARPEPTHCRLPYGHFQLSVH